MHLFVLVYKNEQRVSMHFPSQSMIGNSTPMQFSLVPNLLNRPVIGTTMGNDLERIVSSLTVLKIKYDHHLTVLGHTLEFQVANTFFHCLYLEDKQKFVLTAENTFVGGIYKPEFLNSLQLRDFLFEFVYHWKMMIGSGKPDLVLNFTGGGFAKQFSGLAKIEIAKQFLDVAKIRFNQIVMIESAKRVLDLAKIKYLHNDKTFLVTGKINFSITLDGEWFVFKNENVTFKRTNQAINLHKLRAR